MTRHMNPYRTVLLAAAVTVVSLAVTPWGAPMAKGADSAPKATPSMSHPTSHPAGKAPTSAPAKAGNESQAGLPASIPDIWKAIQAGRVQLDQLTASGQLAGVHEAAFWVRDLVAALPKHSKLSKESAARLKDSSTRVAQIASALDEAGDSGDKAAVTTQLTRLDGVLQIIKGLYPAELTPALEYICPMHSEVRQAKVDKCPKCGMNLVPDAARMPAEHKHGHQ